MRDYNLMIADVVIVVLMHALGMVLLWGIPLPEASLKVVALWMVPILMTYSGLNFLCGLYGRRSDEREIGDVIRVMLSAGLAMLIIAVPCVTLRVNYDGSARLMPLTVVVIGGILSTLWFAILRSRRRSGLILAFASLSLSFVCLEFIVRYLVPEPGPWGIPDSILHHVHPPNGTHLRSDWNGEFAPVLVRFNSLGLREEREFSKKKPANEFRILLLGDSFVEGLQVPYDKTLSQQLEKGLQEWAWGTGDAKAFTVINAGVSGYSPSLEYLYLVHEGLFLRPDVVILYFAFNDVQNDYDRRQTMEVDGQGLPLRVSFNAAGWSLPLPVSRLVSYSRLLQLARIGVVRMKELVRPVPFRLPDWLFDPYDFVGEDKLTKNPLAVFKSQYDQEEVAAWEDTKRYIGGIKRLLAEKRIPFVLAVIPFQAQSSPRLGWIGKVRWGMKRDDMIESTRLQDVLREHAVKHAIYFLDLLPAYKTHGKVKLVYDYDSHWTPEGHRIVAQETLGFLVVNRLVTRSTDEGS